MHKKLIAAVAALGLSAPVLAAQGNNYVDGYFIPFANIDVGPSDTDGDGFGLKGAFQVADQIFLNAEYQSIDYDHTRLDLDQFRLGGSLGPGAGSHGAGLYGDAEYLSLDFDGDNEDGIGGHVGYALPVNDQFRVYGEAGYLVLDHLDGPELVVGGTYQFAPNLGVFADYRASYLDPDGPGDVDLSDFRVGARFFF